jgi:hypothetical protein
MEQQAEDETAAKNLIAGREWNSFAKAGAADGDGTAGREWLSRQRLNDWKMME